MTRFASPSYAGGLTPDTRGIELHNLAEAHDEAVKAIREMIAESLTVETRPVTFQIENEKGEVLLVVTPAEALSDDAGLSNEFLSRLDELRALIKP